MLLEHSKELDINRESALRSGLPKALGVCSQAFINTSSEGEFTFNVSLGQPTHTAKCSWGRSVPHAKQADVPKNSF